MPNAKRHPRKGAVSTALVVVDERFQFVGAAAGREMPQVCAAVLS